MKVGLIPPRGFENYALRSKFHLALAIPELMGRRAYGAMYTRAATLGDYVVLDNGLAEGRLASIDYLLTCAKQLRAHEIVVPDVMKNGPKTIKAASNFFNNDVPLKSKYMAVVQGTKLFDFLQCAEAFANIPFVHTLGIPRHMLETLDNRACRIDFAQQIHDNYPQRFELHFLGTNPVWLSEVKHAVKYVPHVRSVDTSMPFSYTIAGVRLSTTARQIIRPDKYFDTDWSRRVDGALLRENINTLLEWADADRTRTEASASKLRGMSAV